MSGYIDTPACVLRSTDVRPVTHENGAEQRTRFTVVSTAYPTYGVGECSECPSGKPINQAIGEVRYRSALFRGPITEAVCLPCLPGLLKILDSLHEGPLTVALYSPCAGASDDRVRELDREHEDLVALLVAARGLRNVTEMLAQQYAAFSAQLARIAGVA